MPSSRPTTCGARSPTSSTSAIAEPSVRPSPASWPDAEPCHHAGARRPRHAARPASSWSTAFADGVTSQGLDVVDLGLGSTDLLYFAAGSLDAPGAMFTASHNPAQYNGIKFCLAGARPIGEDTGLARDRGGGAATASPAGSPTPTPATGLERTLLEAFADHVRSLRRRVGAAAAEGRRRHRQRHGRPGRAGGVRAPAVRPRGPLRRARRHLPEPPGRSRSSPRTPPTCGPGARGRRRHRPRLRRRRRPGVPRRRDGHGSVGLDHHGDHRRRASSTSTPARRSSTT